MPDGGLEDPTAFAVAFSDKLFGLEGVKALQQEEISEFGNFIIRAIRAEKARRAR